jgi:hypothetical protein
LRLQSYVVFDVPILSDASAGHAINVGGDEIDRLTLDLPEASREVTTEAQMRDDTITSHDYLVNLALGAFLRFSVVSHLIHFRSSTKIE